MINLNLTEKTHDVKNVYTWEIFYYPTNHQHKYLNSSNRMEDNKPKKLIKKKKKKPKNLSAMGEKDYTRVGPRFLV